MTFTREIRSGWNEHFGSQIFNDGERLGMGAEDFGFFTTDHIQPLFCCRRHTCSGVRSSGKWRTCAVASLTTL